MRKGVLFILLVGGGVLAGIAHQLLPVYAFSKEIGFCNKVASELRFSCYRSILEKHSERKSVEHLLNFIENQRDIRFKGNDASYAIFGTNCHTFYHAVGDFVGTHTKGDIAHHLQQGSTRCTSGYMMGFYKRTALQQGFTKEILSTLYHACRPQEQKSCAHEIGHLLHDKYTLSILQTLDSLSSKEYGLEYPQDYPYVTFATADLNAPFEECKGLLSEDLWAYCYQGIGHNLFLYSEFSPEGFKTQFGQCSGVANQINREECYSFLLYRIGINDGATKFLSNDFDRGNAVCKEAAALIQREDVIHHCYLGIGGGIGLFLESEHPYDTISKENLAEVKRSTLRAAELCSLSEKEYQKKCYAGLLGTGFKDMYWQLNLYHEAIEQLLPQLNEGLEVIG